VFKDFPNRLEELTSRVYQNHDNVDHIMTDIDFSGHSRQYDHRLVEEHVANPSAHQALRVCLDFITHYRSELVLIVDIED
jgi:hypothetical protein